MKNWSSSRSKTVITKSSMLTLFLLFFLFFQYAQWKNLSPVAVVNVTSMTNLGSELFIGTNGNGVYHFTDSGSLWVSYNAGLPDYNITALINAGGNVLAGTKYDGVFKLRAERIGQM